MANAFIWRVWGKRWNTSGISFITTVVCHCDWCYQQRERKLDVLHEILYAYDLIFVNENLLELWKFFIVEYRTWEQWWESEPDRNECMLSKIWQINRKAIQEERHVWLKGMSNQSNFIEDQNRAILACMKVLISNTLRQLHSSNFKI